MKDHNQKKQSLKKSPNAIGFVTGTIVGVGIAAAGAVALADKNNREKAKQVFADVKNQAMDFVEDLQKQAQSKKDELEEKINEIKEKVIKKVEIKEEKV